MQEKFLTFSLQYFVHQKILLRNTSEFQDEDNVFSKIPSTVTHLKTDNEWRLPGSELPSEKLSRENLIG